MAESNWPVIHTERRALADDLAGLSEQQWQTQSLCSDWTVHQVLAHQLATAKMTPVRFVTRFAAAGFNFTKFNAGNVAAETGNTPQDTLAEFRSVMSRESAPPGPADTWLGEVIVHGEDIRRPLGIKRSYPTAAVLRAISFYAGSNAIIGSKRRIDGVTLVANDTDFRHGSGPAVEGRVLDLLLATTGRTVALAELSGPGVEILRNR